jgi:hypothetical protein
MQIQSQRMTSTIVRNALTIEPKDRDWCKPSQRWPWPLTYDNPWPTPARPSHLAAATHTRQAVVHVDLSLQCPKLAVGTHTRLPDSSPFKCGMVGKAGMNHWFRRHIELVVTSNYIGGDDVATTFQDSLNVRMIEPPNCDLDPSIVAILWNKALLPLSSYSFGLFLHCFQWHQEKERGGGVGFRWWLSLEDIIIKNIFNSTQPKKYILPPLEKNVIYDKFGRTLKTM